MPIHAVATWDSAEMIASEMPSTRKPKEGYPSPVVAGRSRAGRFPPTEIPDRVNTMIEEFVAAL